MRWTLRGLDFYCIDSTRFSRFILGYKCKLSGFTGFENMVVPVYCPLRLALA